jgi:DNA ligase-1
MPLKPMLAKDPIKLPDGSLKLPFPLIVQPKLDGIRATVQGGVVLSRTLKRIPNLSIQAALGRPEFEGLDGELIVGEPTATDCYRRTTSFVMAPNKTGEPWTFWVFDKIDSREPYSLRRPLLGNAQDAWPANVRLVPEQIADNADELSRMEALLIEQGHEGGIARTLDGLYKHGRSTPGGGPLWKIKRFVDFECVVLDVYEEQHNGNAGYTNELGRTARSTAKDGKVGKGTLGGLIVSPVDDSVCDSSIVFRVGTGFDAAQRRDLWVEHHATQIETLPPRPNGLAGRIAKVKSFPIGVKDKPRHPVFLGWRDIGIDG